MYYTYISMRKDKEVIFNMRRDGKSYRYIQRETGVSRATLTKWFKNEDWSKHISVRNNPTQEESRERMIRLNMVRNLTLQYKYASVEAEAIEQYKTFKNDPLFWAGLMLYAGGGDKKTKHLVRLSNSEFYPHKIFKFFALKYMGIFDKGIHYSLIIYPNNDESVCKERWTSELFADKENFHKTQIIKGRDGAKKLQFGMCTTIICSTSLKKKVLKWLSLAENEKFNAIIV